MEDRSDAIANCGGVEAGAREFRGIAAGRSVRRIARVSNMPSTISREIRATARRLTVQTGREERLGQALRLSRRWRSGGYDGVARSLRCGRQQISVG
jgi:hypothetical protein